MLQNTEKIKVKNLFSKIALSWQRCYKHTKNVQQFYIHTQVKEKLNPMNL